MRQCPHALLSNSYNYLDLVKCMMGLAPFHNKTAEFWAAWEPFPIKLPHRESEAHIGSLLDWGFLILALIFGARQLLQWTCFLLCKVFSSCLASIH
jgi:hypothetical protein